MVPESGNVDIALIQALSGDAQLTALLPGGVYFGTAPLGATAVCMLSLVTAFDEGQFAESPGLRRAVEEITYLVKAVIKSSSPAPASDAAARIDQVLEDQPLTIPGFGWMSTERVERVRLEEVDAVDQKIKWQHHGGWYRVRVTPIGVETP